jgi:hypothetical protein
MTSRKFYKTIVQVEILSEVPIGEITDLDTIHYNITEGEWNGQVSVKSSKELNGKQATKALINQASDPGFFRLDDNGCDLD